MQHLVIDKQDSQLTLERERLILRHDSLARPLSLPLQQVESVVICTRLQLSSDLLSELASRAIRVQIVPNRRPQQTCLVVGSSPANAPRRLRQYQWHALSNTQARWRLARLIVLQRLRQQRHVLEQMQSTCLHNKAEQQACFDRLRQRQARLQRQAVMPLPPMDAYRWLRGIEGAATAIYFQGYRQLFAPALGFKRRNRRPPRDPVNVCLSLAYVLLEGIVTRALHQAGLDPQLGVLHEVAYSRHALACDLMELQRATVERWVYEQFASGVLRREHFTTHPHGAESGCLMGKAGRQHFYRGFATLQKRLSQHAEKHAWILVRYLEPERAHQVVTLSEIGQDTWE